MHSIEELERASDERFEKYKFEDPGMLMFKSFFMNATKETITCVTAYADFAWCRIQDHSS